MGTNESLEEIEKTLEELTEENKTTPILVEGDKDVAALRKLGLTGEIIKLNAGMTLIDFCDMLARKHKKIILLLDWDRKGGFLSFNIIKNLEGRVKCETRYREHIAKRSVIRTVEGLPSWIETLKQKNNIKP